MSDDVKPVSVYDMLAICADQFGSLAWVKLGLQPDPITNAIAKDLAEAKLAIDVLANLASHLEANLDEDDRRDLHILVRNLRLNYVEKTKEGQA